MPITQQQSLQVLPNAGPVAGFFCICDLELTMPRVNAQATVARKRACL